MSHMPASGTPLIEQVMRVITPTALAGGTTSNYAPVDAVTAVSFEEAEVIRQASNAGGSTLSGLVAKSDGHFVIIANLGPGTLTITDEDAGSSAANRFALASNTSLVLAVDSAASFVYDATSARWRAVADNVASSSFSGTANTLVKFATSTTVGNSSITDTGTVVTLSTNVEQSTDGTHFAWDSGGSKRIGFTKKSSAVPKLTYGSGNSLVVAESNATDIGAGNTFTDRLAISTAGNVCIGNNAGIAPLEISDSARAGQTVANITDAGDRGGMLFLNANAASANGGGAILFGNSQSHSANSLGWAGIKGLLTDGSGNTAGDLEFLTRNAASDSSLTERMRIAAGGAITMGGALTVGGVLTVNGGSASIATTGTTTVGNLTTGGNVTINSGALVQIGSATSFINNNNTSFDGPILQTREVVPPQITSNQNDYSPTNMASAAVLLINSDAARDVTGFATGVNGRWLWVYNTGAFNITLKHQTTSSAGNQIRGRGGADTVLTPSTGVQLYYSPSLTKWVVMTDTL